MNNYGGGGGYGQQPRYYNRGAQDDRIQVTLDSNPYANLSNGDNPYEVHERQGGELKFQSDELSEYCLPHHKNKIEYFKILKSDIYESEKRYLPNIILTITDKNEVFLWQENLMIVSA